MQYHKVVLSQSVTAGSESLSHMARKIRAAADKLAEMKESGVTLATPKACRHGYIILATSNATVARQFGFHAEGGLFGEEGGKDGAGAGEGGGAATPGSPTRTENAAGTSAKDVP